MKKLSILLSIFFVSISACAESILIVENVWIREAPPSVKVLAGYMTLKNPTDQDIILICADSPAFEDVMFHKTEISDGIAKMRHADEITIPANSSFELTPGNYHLMLMGKKNPLKEGDNVELTLIFKNIDNQKITATVKKSVAE
jgi:copper(I)-binding protein